MRVEYPHRELLINGRLVQLSDVINDQPQSHSPFEQETFRFIKDWFGSKTVFTQLTSGSTGIPKSIEISREQMIASAAMTAKALELKKDFTSLLCIDPKYIGGKMMLVRAFTIGMKLICVDPLANPFSLLSSDQWVNFAAFVPYQIQTILASNDPLALDRVDIAIIGGAAIQPSAISQLQNRKASCYATYGMTETISHVALQKLNGSNRQEHFHPLNGVRLFKDHRGCLVIESQYLPDPVVTNDLAEFDSDGGFKITGRWDNVINSGGVKVLPEKVEAAIEKLLDASGIKSKFFIYGVTDPVLGQKVALIVEADSHSVVNWEAVVKKLSLSLGRYEVPRAIAVVESFINTESGKINRLHTVKNIQTISPLKLTI